MSDYAPIWILAGLFVAMLIWATISALADAALAQDCIKAGMQWVDGNCVVVPQ